MTVIRLSGITKRFGSTLAVDGVTLEIGSGELFFLLGPSGCGKTTLLRILAGFTPPDSGEVSFDAHCVNALPPQRRDCGMVFQNYALWPHLSVADNVAFGLEVRRIDARQRRERVHEALAMVHLQDLADRRPGELSGGQQQRVALARALVVRPRCLLLDEPLSNLDAKLRVEMRSEIRRLCKQARLTTVYVTHDQKEALSMADRVALLRDGAVVQCDTPQRLYRCPSTRFAADFLGEANFVSARVVAVDNGEVTLETAFGQFAKSADAGPAVAPDPPYTAVARSEPGGGRAAARAVATPTHAPEGALIGNQTLVMLGGTVTCALRPEAIHIGRSEPLDAGASSATLVRFTATVVESTYLGESAQHVVQMSESGVRLRVLESNPTGAAPSGRVSAWFSTEDVILLYD